ncbi:MAG: DUF308 domain-containing protein [Lachnospiraceae bacterium]|nr:DUF308 domain-containing protein [Ruminococcus sp.]MCM1273817.1 DUF308 domain-containing protein [Lachnospiraceae bacterium]
MKLLKQNGGTVILCVAELVIGVLLLINPVGFTSWIIRLVGIALLVNGLISVIRYFGTEAAEAARQRLLMQGLILLLGGGFCVIDPNWLIAVFPVIALLYGVAILVAGLGKVQMTVDMIRLKVNKWFLSAISALVSIACAAVIITNPFASTVALWMFAGISLIAEAIFDVVVLIVTRRRDGSES